MRPRPRGGAIGAFVGSLYLPWAFKWIAGPFVDTFSSDRFGCRRGDPSLAPGQERHLRHAAWHVVQQAQGRVRPTMTMNGGVPVNDHAHLEREADAIREKLATQRKAAKAGGGTS